MLIVQITIILNISSIYKVKLLENTEADGANTISRNTAVAMLLKSLSNFWRSFEMLLMNYKVELRLKWTNHYVLSENVNDNDDTNFNNVIFIIKDTKATDTEKLSKPLTKGFEDEFIWINIKQKKII